MAPAAAGAAEAGAPFNVVFLGAGEIHFGTPEGPWNHSQRLETLLGARLRVLALVDPDLPRCHARLAAKRSHVESSVRQAWQDTVCAASPEEAAEQLRTNGEQEVHLVLIGAPPHVRGSLAPGCDLEVCVLQALGHAKAIFLEKPVAAADPLRPESDAGAVQARLEQWAADGKVVGVGYMLRYLRPVQLMKQLMNEHQVRPMCLNARYYMAYEQAVKPGWWDVEISGGPIVEQATHFVDLLRYLAGTSNPALADTILAHTVRHDEPAGQLSKLGFDEKGIVAPQRRIPRVTNAIWKHADGTIASLCHVIGLHAPPYHTELEVLADGWRFALQGTYTTAPKLAVRKPGSAEDEVYEFPDDDPFEHEFEAMISAVDAAAAASGSADGKRESASAVLSSYADARQTYNMTWQIRRATERSMQELAARKQGVE